MARVIDDRSKRLEQLRREHLKLDSRLQALEAHRWVSPEEEAEIRRLKRLKLATKDAMQALDGRA